MKSAERRTTRGELPGRRERLNEHHGAAPMANIPEHLWVSMTDLSVPAERFIG